MDGEGGCFTSSVCYRFGSSSATVRPTTPKMQPRHLGGTGQPLDIALAGQLKAGQKDASWTRCPAFGMRSDCRLTTPDVRPNREISSGRAAPER